MSTMVPRRIHPRDASPMTVRELCEVLLTLRPCCNADVIEYLDRVYLLGWAPYQNLCETARQWGVAWE